MIDVLPVEIPAGIETSVTVCPPGSVAVREISLRDVVGVRLHGVQVNIRRNHILIGDDDMFGTGRQVDILPRETNITGIRSGGVLLK